MIAKGPLAGSGGAGMANAGELVKTGEEVKCWATSERASYTGSYGS
jgi:hypothetical protein